MIRYKPNGRGIESMKGAIEHARATATLLFVLALLGVSRARAAPRPPTSEAEQIKVAQQGLDLLMNGDPDAAIKVFRRIESDDPDSALGYLMDADALWWKIYFATGDLIDPDVFVVPSGSKTPYDSRFNKLVDTAIAKARANRSANRDVARNYLYEGMAYGLRGRLASMRENNLAAARAAKQMRSLLIDAVQQRLAPRLGPVGDHDTAQKQRRHRAPHRPAMAHRAGHVSQRVGQSGADGEDAEHLDQVR